MADKTPWKIISKPGLLMFATAARTMCSKVKTLLTLTGQGDEGINFTSAVEAFRI